MSLKKVASAWTCPKCRRKFTRTNQLHTCGTGTRAEVLKHRKPEVVALFAALEAHVKTFGAVEFVPRERYIILRDKHIFADLVMLADGLKIVVHLPRMVRLPLFKKIVADRLWVSHVAKIRNPQELALVLPLLQEAWAYAQSY